MIHSRTIKISVGATRKSTDWKCQTLTIAELYGKLQTPARSSEAYAAYIALKKSEQDTLKDIGGFVAGELSGPRRKAHNVKGRDIITLDLDTIPPGDTQEVLRRVEALGCGYCVYSTRKHHPASPRLRVLIPTNRTVTADEYEPIARKMAELIGMQYADPTTFEASRMMYWPSCCSDGEYIFLYQDKSLLNADGVLSMYQDWHGITSWPGLPTNHVRLAAKQGDPTAKGGVVGAFCRSFDVYAAIDAFLQGVYTEVDDEPTRFTFVEGSTAGGAVVYENGKFLYSHHATDPCSGRLVNSFDLVRLHKFEDLDDGVKADTPINRLPSFTEMCKFAVKDDKVRAIVTAERGAEALRDFEGITATSDLESFAGEIAGATLTTGLVRRALEAMGITIKLNTITHRVSLSGSPIGWSKENAENNLPIHLRDFFKSCDIRAPKSDVADSLDLIADEERFNPVAEALKDVAWDGVDRIDEAARDILGLTDDFSIMLVRKWFWQTVALAINNDHAPYGAEGVLVLQGPQGIGKTSFFRQITPWPELFAEGRLVNERDKDSIIQATECWICELGELERMTRKEDKTLKALITSPRDNYRTPYARKAADRVRRTSFCGTVNPEDYLVDDTGNRRYWTVKVTSIDTKRLYSLDYNWKLQLWAQAYSFCMIDAQGFRLSGEARKALEMRNILSVAPRGEEYLVEILDPTLPKERWKWVRPAQIVGFIPSREIVSAEAVGKALHNLVRKGWAIETKRTNKGQEYLVPLSLNSESVPK